MNNNKKRSLAFREVLPFLQMIPNSIYFNLDTRDFFLPEKKMGNYLYQVEITLGNYIMPYALRTWHNTSPEMHLCAYIACAQLTERKKRILREVEDRLKPCGASIAVYAKPLQFIEPKESLLYIWYKKNYGR